MGEQTATTAFAGRSIWSVAAIVALLAGTVIVLLSLVVNHAPLSNVALATPLALGLAGFPRLMPLMRRLAGRSSSPSVAEPGRRFTQESDSRPRDVATRLVLQAALYTNSRGYLLARDVDGTSTEVLAGGQAANALRNAASKISLLEHTTGEEIDVGGKPVLLLPMEGGAALLLGPKKDGSAFLETEWLFAEPIATVLGMLMARSQLNQELQDLNQQIMATQEEERALLAMEIHDGPLQQAVYLSRLDSTNGTVAEVAHTIVSELRAMSRRLRPPLLDELGLRYAIDWLTKNAAEQHNLAVDFQADSYPEEARISQDIELAVYRCVQESLNNVVKHAQATKATVFLSLGPERVVAQIKDNGTGFGLQEQQEAFEAGHLGIVGMRERVRQVGGTLRIVGHKGTGTAINVSMPLKREART